MLNILPTTAAAEDAADNSMLSLQGLVKTFSYTIDFDSTIDLRPTVTDIRGRAAQSNLMLTPAFDNFCSTLLSTGSCTIEAMAKLCAAYAVCAFYSAYYADVVAAYANTTHRGSRMGNARAKAILVAAVTFVGFQLTTAFIAEDRAALYATCAANSARRTFKAGSIVEDSTSCARTAADKAESAAHEALKAVDAVRTASELAVQAGATLTPPMLLAAEAAADRAHAAAKQASRIVHIMDANLYRFSSDPKPLSALSTAKDICAEAATEAANHANTMADYTNASAIRALHNAIGRPPNIKRPTYEKMADLDFRLTEVALYAHHDRASQWLQPMKDMECAAQKILQCRHMMSTDKGI